MISYSFLYFIVLNIITFAVFGYDKFLATKNKWRIPERTLFTLSFLGGSIGAIIGMLLFRHKISKSSFYITIAVIIIVQIVVLWYFGVDGLMGFLN